MNIILNNRPESFDQDTLTVSSLLIIKNFTFKMLVVRVNGVLVRVEDFATTVIQDGDQVLILHLISGG